MLEIATSLMESPSLLDLFESREALDFFLDAVRVDIRDVDGFMWVDDREGVVAVSRDYLANGPVVGLYLDFVHEVVHMKQLRDGLELYDRSQPYVRRPTEVEAYRVTVAEARRLGVSDEELVEYLRVPWISEEEHEELLETLGVG